MTNSPQLLPDNQKDFHSILAAWKKAVHDNGGEIPHGALKPLSVADNWCENMVLLLVDNDTKAMPFRFIGSKLVENYPEKFAGHDFLDYQPKKFHTSCSKSANEFHDLKCGGLSIGLQETKGRIIQRLRTLHLPLLSPSGELRVFAWFEIIPIDQLVVGVQKYSVHPAEICEFLDLEFGVPENE
jgi:hypothetical protein